MSEYIVVWDKEDCIARVVENLIDQGWYCVGGVHVQPIAGGWIMFQAMGRG